MIINDKNFKNILANLNILYIEDEKNIRENITKTLKMFCSKIFSAENVQDALLMMKDNRIDIIISDINLPKITGIDFIKKIRETDSYIPVIFLSAYTEKDYLLEATRLKLVDYLVKPIDFNMLKEALIRACKEIVKEGKYIVNFEGNISYNVMNKKLYHTKKQEEIDITAKEVELLECLIHNHTRVVSHEEIKEKVWDNFYEASDSALKNLLNKLRKKIGKDSIKNISGVGFKIHFS